jgi:metal-responsive CopG/Arc/MetJ family transcriptional regulator
MPKPKVVKVSISLPEDIYEAIERERHALGETRSEYLAHSVQTLLRQKQEREWDEEYRRAYEEQPETEEERAVRRAFMEASLQVWARESPWEDDETE